MDDTKPISLEQMQAFVAAGGSAEFEVEDGAERYACVERTLRHLDYPQLGRADKGLVKQYLSRLTGLCRAQLTRLIGSYAAKGSVTVAPYQRRKFPAHYTEADIRLLAYVDQAHGTLSGPATRRILQREYREYSHRSLPALGGDQFGADLSLSQDRRVSQTPHQLPTHAAHSDPHRRAPQARSEWPAGISAHRHRAPRRSGGSQGLVSHQRSGPSHAMAGGWSHTPHLRSVAIAVVGKHVGTVSFPHPRLSFRQRQRVHQLPSFRFIEQTPDRADQVAATSFRRQRLGGVQERLGDSQTSGLDPHRQPACRSRQPVPSPVSESVLELAPALRHCRASHACQRQDQARLPAMGDALGYP